MDRKAFWNVLFLSVLIALVFTGWQIVTVEAGSPQAAGISSGDIGENSDPRNLDLILLNNQGYKKKRKGPVEFTHKKHAYQYKLFCWGCHHDYKDGQNVWVPWGETKRCNQCHDPKNKEHNKIMLQKAFHYQCKGCHKDLAKKKMKTGAYRKCGGCHLKMEKN
ncbi:MAG: cytochrome c3 family protein [Desulfosarcina sp.]|nr:cytochrome c3 family protein [Desulfobacterales bacterium]